MTFLKKVVVKKMTNKIMWVLSYRSYLNQNTLLNKLKRLTEKYKINNDSQTLVRSLCAQHDRYFKICRKVSIIIRGQPSSSSRTRKWSDLSVI